MQNPIPIESRALGTLAYIRASIEASGSMAIPGMAGIVMGLIGFSAAIATSLPRLADRWLPIWLVAGAAGLLVGGAVMARQAAANGHARHLGPVRKFMFCLCPALMAGAVLTLVLWQAKNAGLIPGVWLLLYGCAVLSASTVTIARTRRLIQVMGFLFMLLALLAFAAPAGMQTLVLGLGFGALHSLFGMLIGQASHGD